MGSQHSEFKLTGIAFAWAITGVVHLLTFKWILPFSWDGVLYLFVTLFLLIRPASLLRLTTFLAATALILFRNYEILANHLVLEFWIIISLLAGGLVSCLHLRRQQFDFANIFHQLAPLVRVQYLLIFCFAFFSKLNADFLSPESSCAALFAKRLLEAFHLETLSLGLLSPLQPSIGYVAIYLTLAFEIAIPSLLIFGRTRKAGIYIALFFHLVMGLIPILGISSFSSLSFTLLLFFFPDTALVTFNKNLTKATRLLGNGKRTRLITKAILSVAVLCLIGIQHRYFHPTVGFANTIWVLASVPLGFLMLVSLKKTPLAATTSGTHNPISFFLPQSKALALLNLPVILLGTLPYFAIQIQGSFTMFSNLRILGERPNHLLIGPPSPSSSPKLIRILGTNHPNLESYPESDTLITDHEFKRRVANTTEDFHVLCEYDNQIILIGRFDGELTPHPFLEPLDSIPSRYLRFRDVSTSERCECTW